MSVQVLGIHWGAYLEQGHLGKILRPTAASEYPAPRLSTRAEVQAWVDTHTGDFAEITDFASLPDIPFADDENDLRYHDLMYGDPACDLE